MSVARLVLVILLGACSISSVHAQELRVYTRTVDLTGLPAEQQAKAPIVARSLTLFHANKVYDYIDSAREVTVYEPIQKRFTILHEASGTVTTISSDQVRRFIEIAEDEALQMIASGQRNGTATTLEFLRFQIRPKFTVQYEEPAHRLRLDHTQMRYEADCAAPPEGMIAKAYFDYADAIAELNAVLHPQSLLPAPRLQLNEELRHRDLLPRSVRRQIHGSMITDLRADHEWVWTLSDYDRQMIAKWDRQLRDENIRKLEFRQFQQETLTGKLTAR